MIRTLDRSHEQLSEASSSNESSHAFSSPDLEEEDVNDLLWEAQSDLIGHRQDDAVSKLRKACALDSSAACATLGNLLTRQLRSGTSSTSKSPPTIAPSLESRPWPDNATKDRHDVLAGVSLFAHGLKIELRKPLQRRHKSQQSRLKERARERDDDEQMTDSEEENIEGKFFNLERSLDLSLGLTDAYRYGLIHPDDDIWTEAASVAERALKHPVINPYANVESSVFPRVVTTSPTKLVERSYKHPMTIMPATGSAQSTIAPETKIKLTLEVHLWYLLALSKWPKDQVDAERCWRQIVNVAGTNGVGTREGNEILEKARNRLSHAVDDSWKHAKRRKNSLSSSDASTSTSAQPRRKMTMRTKSQQSDRTLVEDSTAATAPPMAMVADAISNGRTPSDSSKVASASFRSTKATFHFANHADEDYPTPPPSDSSSPSPPPPEQPKDDPRPVMSTSPPRRPPPRRVASSASFYPRNFLPRVKSSVSVATVPAQFDLSALPPVQPTATGVQKPTTRAAISSPVVDGPVKPEKRSWQGDLRMRLGNLRMLASKMTTSIKTTTHPWLPSTEEKQSDATSSLQAILKRDDEAAGPGMYWASEDDVERLETNTNNESLSETPEAPSMPTAAPASPDNRPPARRTVSESVVKRPRHVRSSGSLYKDRVTALQQQECSRGLRKNRSFVDPTSQAPSSRSRRGQPKFTVTPPTPDKHTLATQSTLAVSRPRVPSSIDPCFEELERQSRVGVKTVCSTCGKRGLNFPACPRCKETYCSRTCRVASGRGGDGVRHVCR